VEEAKILVAEGLENNLDVKVLNERWIRWQTCSLCEQHYHGVVRCALSWACWKTYLGRPEVDQIRIMAMNMLGLGLSDANNDEDALSVQEAELAMKRRLGRDEEDILAVQSNLAITYQALGRLEEASRIQRDAYYGYLKLNGEEHINSLGAASNYAKSLRALKSYKGAKFLLRRTIPVARRALGEGDVNTLRMRWNYAMALYEDSAASLDDLHEAVTTLEETERTARRVLGGAHPQVVQVGLCLRKARDALAARESDDVSSVCEAVAAANLRTA